MAPCYTPRPGIWTLEAPFRKMAPPILEVRCATAVGLPVPVSLLARRGAGVSRAPLCPPEPRRVLAGPGLRPGPHGVARLPGQLQRRGSEDLRKAHLDGPLGGGLPPLARLP